MIRYTGKLSQTIRSFFSLKKLALGLLGVSLVGVHSVGFSDSTPNYDRETRITEQIEPDIFDGEAVWLSDGERDFLSIYLPAEDEKGAIILLHGRDVNPEEQNLIGPLRVGLAEQGWSTLALQMPVLAKGKTYYDYLPILSYAHPRIEAAIRFLEDQNQDRVIALGAHSCGVHMANDWFNKGGGQGIDAYIAMGMGATDAGQELKTPFPIASLDIPVLDVYGDQEFPRPLAMVAARKMMIDQNGHRLSKQQSVEGANHYFTDQGEAMVGVLGAWLETLANGL